MKNINEQLLKTLKQAKEHILYLESKMNLDAYDTTLDESTLSALKLIDDAIDEADQKYYLLLGSDVCKTYIDESLDDVVEVLNDCNGMMVEVPRTISQADLLYMASGYNDYAFISKSEYDYLYNKTN